MTYDQRWTIRWAVDARARRRIRAELRISAELEEIRAFERGFHARAREAANRVWVSQLPEMFREWQRQQEAA